MMRKLLTEHKKENAQGIVEFALILPILLLVILGIIEMGRLLFFYSSVASASREGARYGSAVGNVNGTPYFADCDGIRAAALKAGSFAGLENGDIEILYDDGITMTAASCPPNTRIDLKDRIVVSASGTFTPIVPLVDIFFPDDGIDVSSVTGRTIIKEVGIQGTPAPLDTPEPTPTPVCPPTSLTAKSEEEDLTIQISNPDVENVYYLREIELKWPGGGPRLESITFTSPFTSSLTLAPSDNPPKFHIEPDDPDEKPFIWYGRFANPGILIFTFDEDLSGGDLYKIYVRFSRCPLLSTSYFVPEDD